MARKGFLALVHRELKRSARESERRQKVTQRAYAAAEREAEVARKREVQAYAQAQKASAADQKRFEKEAKESHYSAMAAEVERMNLKLSEIAEDLDGILASTLDVDDFLDLETLKIEAVHPPFNPDSSLLKPQTPLLVADPVAPTYVEPTTSKLYIYFLGKKNHKKKVAAARAKYESESEAWKITIEQVRARRIEEAALYEKREIQRLAALQAAQDRYAAKCAERDQEAANQNYAVNELIANLGYGMPDAIEEYIGIVLSNAIYPDHFPIEHEFSYVPDSAELTLRVSVPAPSQISTIKSYKYTKSTDEIAAVQMTTKACKDRYARAIHQVALRVPHEVFEADRRGLIGSISLEVGTHTTNPATGLSCFIPFVATGVSREEFLKLELSNVLPEATLRHLGASVSKNPFELVPAMASGVRRS
jgi:restriction system protein